MNAAVQMEINNAVRAINQSMQPHKIYLFGSQASGSATPDSDIDLCVVTALGGMRKIEALRLMRRAMSSEVNLPVDLLVYDDADFALRSVLPSTMEHRIVADGLVLYEQ